MVSLVIIITWHGNNMCVQACGSLFYQHNSNVYDRVNILTVLSFTLDFIVHPSIIHGKIRVVNNLWCQVDSGDYWVWW